MNGQRQSLVVGYMNDPEGLNALRYAVVLANQLASDLHVLHVLDLSDFPLDPDSQVYEDQGERMLAGEEAQVRSEMTALNGKFTYATARGDAAVALSQHGDLHNAMMVVVGTHGEHPGSGLARFFGGSVSRSLLRHLNRPVLIIPMQTDDVR